MMREISMMRRKGTMMSLSEKRTPKLPADILNVLELEIGEIDSELNERLEKGKTERVRILDGTEGPRTGTTPYARTYVEISFDNEEDLRQCVLMLRWSDERLQARPEQLLLWEWNVSFREGMTIFFGVNWYDKAFFEKRQHAFVEPSHAAYYSVFGAKPEDFKIRHEVYG